MNILKVIKQLFATDKINPSKLDAIDFLENECEKHPIMKHQVESTIDVLSAYLKKWTTGKENIGLAVSGVDGIGKTYFIIEFLSKFFYIANRSDKETVFKINNKQLILQYPNFLRLVKFYNKKSLDIAYNKIKPGSVVILDNIFVGDRFTADIVELIKKIYETEKHKRTVLILSSDYKAQQDLKREYPFLKDVFKNDFSIHFPKPTPNQLTLMFVNYLKYNYKYSYNLDEDSILQYFNIKAINMELETDLLNKGVYLPFKPTRRIYALDFKYLLDYFTQNNSEENTHLTLINSTLLQEEENKNKLLEELK